MYRLIARDRRVDRNVAVAHLVEKRAHLGGMPVDAAAIARDARKALHAVGMFDHRLRHRQHEGEMGNLVSD
jgi:hypothetical protein